MAFAATERKCEEGAEDGHVRPSVVTGSPALRMGSKTLLRRDSERRTAAVGLSRAPSAVQLMREDVLELVGHKPWEEGG